MATRMLTFGVCAALSSMGCYTYAPATLETVPQGARIRAILSTGAQVDLERRVGLDARELEGELVERDATKVLIAVRVPPPPTGLGTGQPLRQRIDVAPGDILRVDQRMLDGARTGLLIGGFAAVAAAAVVLAFEGGNPGDSPNGGPPPEESRRRYVISMPLIRW